MTSFLPSFRAAGLALALVAVGAAAQAQTVSLVTKAAFAQQGAGGVGPLPPGARVRNLRYRGVPLRDDQPLRIALNNYRAAGSAGYSMFRDAKIVWRSGREIRDLMADYFAARKRLPEKPDGNWRLLLGNGLAFSTSTSGDTTRR